MKINNDFQNIYSQLNIQEIDQMVDILNKINWEFEISYNEYDDRKYDDAIDIFLNLVTDGEFTDFLTIPAYEHIN